MPTARFAFQTSERRISITTGIRHGIFVYTDIFTLFDGAYYGMVMSVRPSIRPFGSPSVSHSFPHFSPTCFDILS